MYSCGSEQPTIRRYHTAEHTSTVDNATKRTADDTNALYRGEHKGFNRVVLMATDDRELLCDQKQLEVQVSTDTTTTTTLSPGVESTEDSCYDTDDEADSQHEDVSRQSSDTLATELEPDRDFQKSSLQRSHPVLTAEQMSPSSAERNGLTMASSSDPSDSSTSSSESDDASQYPGYADKVDFTIKLGYREDDLQYVLKKCGPNVTQNDLLSELISLNTKTSLDIPASEQEVEESDIVEEFENTPNVNDEDNLRSIIIDGSNVAKR